MNVQYCIRVFFMMRMTSDSGLSLCVKDYFVVDRVLDKNAVLGLLRDNNRNSPPVTLLGWSSYGQFKTETTGEMIYVVFFDESGNISTKNIIVGPDLIKQTKVKGLRDLLGRMVGCEGDRIISWSPYESKKSESPCMYSYYSPDTLTAFAVEDPAFALGLGFHVLCQKHMRHHNRNANRKYGIVLLIGWSSYPGKNKEAGAKKLSGTPGPDSG